jgi:hypothetical protein
MPSSAVTPALPLLPVAPLDGESGYLRWKESVLLRLHTLGLAHVLSEEERPAGVKQRAGDDALCRGHILATLSDRLLPAYAHHDTAGAVWRAVGLTYDLDMSRSKASAFRYDEDEPLLEQLALLEALATVGNTLGVIAFYVDNSGFPWEMVQKVREQGLEPRMDEIWKIFREQVRDDRAVQIDDDSPPVKRGRSYGRRW